MHRSHVCECRADRASGLVVLLLLCLWASLSFAAAMPELARRNDCVNCHAIDTRVVGPAWMDVSRKYLGDPQAEEKVLARVSKGSSGFFGRIHMPANDPDGKKQEEMRSLVRFILDLAKPSTSHALIMTISQYQGGVPPLKGVRYDAENARKIAYGMGIRDENMRFLKDDQLTLAGIRSAFDELGKRLAPGDQVFVYYSGHGGRAYRKEPAERCAESLIAVDAQDLLDSELEASLKELSEKAQKVIVFIDACHSGGVTTRAIDPPFAPKYWSKGEADACAKPVNVLTRSLGLAAKTVGSGARNYVYIAAARDNEISLDQPGKGGVATQAWLKCLSGEAADADGSGGLSVEEVRSCAQAKIDGILKDAKGFVPHHLSISGNADMVIKLADTSASLQTRPTSVSTPEAAMRDIYNGRDDKRVVTLTPNKPALKIGSDAIGFTLTSTHAGYVYILMAGSDGKTFDMLFPNKIDGANFIQAGEGIKLPRPNWELVAQGPEGKDRLLAIVADSPRDFSSSGMMPAGPFSTVAANQSSAKDIQSVTGVSANAASSECQNQAKTRTLAVVAKRCSNAYGAALLTIDEVR